MPSFRELLEQTRATIREIDVPTARAMTEASDDVLIDVREQDEIEQGVIPGAITIPRGFLESRVEEAVPEKERRIVIYCAGGTRSAFAAKSLAELGYTNVASLAGGFNAWKDAGAPWQLPKSLTPEQRVRIW